jgi:hypothetical protein
LRIPISALLIFLLALELENAAWYYPEPMEKASNIKGYVAFCEIRPKINYPDQQLMRNADKPKVDIHSE